MLNPDFRDMLFALSEERVEFLLVGAYAMAVHGMPRAMRDLADVEALEALEALEDR